MLKTNSKQARENVRNYIISNYTGDSYGWEDAKTFEEIARAIMTAFYRERAKPLVEDRHYFQTYQDAFYDWCSGLPSIIDTCYFYNRSAIADLGDILDETIAERERYSETDASYLLTYLIYREICKVCDFKAYRD